MERKKHIKRHKELHHSLDELIADWISLTKCLPSKASVMELMQWSHEQTIDPSEVE